MGYCNYNQSFHLVCIGGMNLDVKFTNNKLIADNNTSRIQYLIESDDPYLNIYLDYIFNYHISGKIT